MTQGRRQPQGRTLNLQTAPSPAEDPQGLCAVFWKVQRGLVLGRQKAYRRCLKTPLLPLYQAASRPSPPSPDRPLRGPVRHPARMALQPARERQAALSYLSRRHGDIQGVAHVKSVPPEVFEALKGLTQESSVIVTGKVRADKRAPGGYELDVEDVQVVQRVPEVGSLPHHAQGARRRFPHGAPASVGALAAASRHSAHAR